MIRRTLMLSLLTAAFACSGTSSILDVDESRIGPGSEGSGPSLPKINIDSVSANENSGTMAFTVSLDIASSSPVTVDYAGSANTAQGAGVDYSLSPGTLTIPAGNTSGTITVIINNDNLDEASENFSVNLANAIGGTIQGSIGVGTINDDDATPTLSISDVTANEGDGTMSMSVTLSAASGQTVTVDYSAGGGTAQVVELIIHFPPELQLLWPAQRRQLFQSVLTTMH